MTLARRIFLALGLGIALGLFFGEKIAFMGVLGRAFVQLLQITVLPYVAGSLVYGFGSLSAKEARLVFSRGGALLLLLWALTLAFVFPELQAFSRPYAEEEIAFLTLDHRRTEFEQWEALRGRRVKIAILKRPQWIEALARALPLAEVVGVSSPLDFAEGRVQADAYLTGWARACALSLLYPELSPAQPAPSLGRFTIAYAVPPGEDDLLNVVNTFVEEERTNGRFESARRHWILGEATRVQQPRWSVARNVLGWWKQDR